MKKLISVLIAFLLVFSAAAFAQEAAVGMPNPVAEVTDDDAFEYVLGIEFDADDLMFDNLRMSIINNTLGQVTFTQDNVNGEAVEWTIRFTKDASFDSSVELFAGIYDQDISEPETREISFKDDEDDPEVSIVLTSMTARTEGYDIYFWQIGDVYYALTVNDVYSQMQFAETADRIFEACLD